MKTWIKAGASLLALISLSTSTSPLLANNDALANLSITPISSPTTTLGKFSQGKPLYLKFWASWCVNCLQEMPQLQEDFVRYKKDIQFLSINVGIDDTKDDVKRIYQEYGLNMPAAIDTNGQLAQQLEFVGTPYHLVFSRGWQVLYRGHEANEALQQALKLATTGQQSDQTAALITPIHAETIAFGIPANAKVFYIAAWCDWYMKGSDKALADHCKVTAQRIATLEKTLNDEMLVIVASPLWTDDKVIDEYKERFGIQSAIHIDHNNAFAQKFNIRNFGVELDF